MAFYQRKGSKTYHTVTRCSKVPRNVNTNQEWTARGSKPKGKMCGECAAKERPKPRKKKVVKKKAARKTKVRRTKRK